MLPVYTLYHRLTYLSSPLLGDTIQKSSASSVQHSNLCWHLSQIPSSLANLRLQKKKHIVIFFSPMAERVGFEPTVALNHTELATLHNKPLWHLSVINKETVLKWKENLHYASLPKHLPQTSNQSLNCSTTSVWWIQLHLLQSHTLVLPLSYHSPRDGS